MEFAMTPRQFARVALVLTAPLGFQACATKGYVRTQAAGARAYSDSTVRVERDARVAGDKELSDRIVALRKDLDSLRSQFGARIAAMEDGLHFAMPVTFAYD